VLPGHGVDVQQPTAPHPAHFATRTMENRKQRSQSQLKLIYKGFFVLARHFLHWFFFTLFSFVAILGQLQCLTLHNSGAVCACTCVSLLIAFRPVAKLKLKLFFGYARKQLVFMG